MVSLQESFVCSICDKYQSDTSPNWFVTTPKGHVFHFYGCIKEWINAGRPGCPFTLCNETLDIQSLTRLRGINPCEHLSSAGKERSTSKNGNASAGTSCRKDLSFYSPTSPKHTDYTFQSILLGEPAVGKSSLLQRFTQGTFNPSVPSTIGYGLASKSINIGGKVVKMNLWDTNGQEKYNSLTKNFVRTVHGVVLTYSYGEETNSLSCIKKWMEYVQESGIPGAGVILVGNKSDIPEIHRSINTDEGQKLARELEIPFFETSARDDLNVDAVFRALAVEIIAKIESDQLDYQNPAPGPTNILRVRNQDPNFTENRKRCSC